MKKAIFEKDAKVRLLELLSKKVNEEGYIVDERTNDLILTTQGETIKVDEWGAYEKGSEIFVKSDLVSLISFMKNKS